VDPLDAAGLGGQSSAGAGPAGAKATAPPVSADPNAADLAVTSVKAANSIVRATTDNFSVSVTVENRGKSDAATIPLLPRLSKGSVALDDDPGIADAARIDKKPLKAGASRAYTLSAAKMPGLTHSARGGKTVPTAGTWQLGVTADPGGIVDDRDRANNTMWDVSPFAVTDTYGNGATDPRLGYTQAAKERAATLDPQKLPFTSAASWNSREILSNWSQVDGADAGSGPDATDTDEWRCGPTSAIASAVLSGPAAVRRLTWKLSDKGIERFEVANAGDLKDPAAAARARELSHANGMVIGCLTELSDPEKATYGTLSRLAHAAKIIMTGAKNQAATGHEMLELLGLEGKTERAPYGHVKDRGTFDKALSELKHGERYHVLIDTDVRAAHRKDYATGEVNHWVMIAAVGSSKAEPRVVLYDPYPREGKQVVFKDEPGFWKPFENDAKDGGAFRGCLIATRSRPS
jgi:hypothetical protein